MLGETNYSYGVERFGTVEVGKEKQKGKGRREREIEELMQRICQVRKQWRKSDDPHEKFRLSQLRDDLKSRLALLRKAERRRKMRKAKRKKRAAIYENHHKFTMKLFEENKNGVLEVPQDELEDHLRRMYTAKSQQEVRASETGSSTTPFDLSEPRLKEVRNFFKRAQAGTLPRPMASRTRSTRHVQDSYSSCGDC